MTLEELQRFCVIAPEDERRADKAKCTTPFVVEFAGVSYAVATDGIWLVGATDVAGVDRPSPFVPNPILTNAFRPKKRMVELAALREFAGEPAFPSVKTCPFCEGSTWCRCANCRAEQAHCSDCKLGVIFTPIPAERVCRVFSVYVNQPRLAALLSTAPEDRRFVDVHVKDDPDPYSAIAFRTEGWFAVLMPIYYDPDRPPVPAPPAWATEASPW